MKANVITGTGKASEVFKIIEMDRPSPKVDEVLVRVHYTSVNPADCRIRTIPNPGRSFPAILGYDVFGEVTAVGQQVIGLSPGDNIIASPSLFLPGANAEYVCIKSNMCLKVDELDPKIGAAIPLVGITAYEALFDRLKLKPSHTILIQAGAGGVGHIAIQLAKKTGSRVITTSSRTASLQYCRDVLKADHVINYKEENVAKKVLEITGQKGVDLILDTVGNDTFVSSLGCLRPAGHICTILPVHYDALTGYENLLNNRTISYEYMGMSASSGRHREILKKLVGLIQKNELAPLVSEVYPFDQIHKAHEAIETGHTQGKIVIKVM
ncbi:zinc-binding dehydrogenase [Echinicola soli]|uniref:Zinc-binding dehydrogenase n=1 Tax=Echinicola soli TaxID=2591634 RepID=A0A514CN03_9BACT|nr:zinc-binding dehydrogenase [Echinicola soli]QDH81178.1 zinc-binding dehydrogenase [Echinicola soli]